ncbi:MAG: deoxycytidylate deaminase [Methylocystaceae bacterium]
MIKTRPSWDMYFMEVSRLVATRSTCLRRHVGAVLVRDERIIATGYNGAPQGLPHCADVGCLREQQGIPSGQRYELCRGVHAEQNAIINAALYGVSTKSSTLYCTDQPCLLCARMIINAGVTRIVHEGNFQDDMALQFLHQAGIKIINIVERSDNE